MSRPVPTALLRWSGIAVGGPALLAGVTLTLLRLIGGDLRQLAWGQAFAPWAIPAYLVALPVALVLVARPGERLRRRVVVPVAAVALAGLTLHAAWVAPMFVGAAPAAATDGPTLTVMTTNLRFGSADPGAVLRAAEEHDVDVLVLQEITTEALAGLEDAGLEESFGHRGGRPAWAASGTMAFSRTPITDEREIETAMGSFGFSTAGHDMIAVHPAYPLDERWADELALLRDEVAATEPDLVLGDFNASLDHAPMRAILDAGLRDAAEAANAGWQPTWPADRSFRGLPLPLSVAIDHVLLGPEVTAVRTHTVEIADTDHLGLIAEVGAAR